MAGARDPRPLVIEIASPLLDRALTAFTHAAAVAASGRPVWLVFSGSGVGLLTPAGLARARTSGGQPFGAIAMRRDVLGLPDITTYRDSFRTLPVRFFVHGDDLKEQGIDAADFNSPNFNTPVPVEQIDRISLIKNAGSDAWMVF